ncbi:MAG: hypothetical protein LBE02_03595 [Spirochaetaceae bacterium]|jgi:hypothetical protein|nr:hypothetical protein [Spirochaetaceae bacterium]
MTGFLLQKFFYDLWDNLFRIMALNLGFLVSLSLVFVLPPLIGGTLPGLLVFCLLVFWLFVYLCAASAALEPVSNYRTLSLGDFVKNLTSSLVPGTALFFLALVIFVIIRFTIPVYLRFGTVFGTAAAFFCCWICLFFLGTLQFYPAVYRRLGKRPLICLKKCFILFFDNTGFCIFSLLVNLIFTVLIIPCPGWSLLFLDEGLRLRILKYDAPNFPRAGENSGRKPRGVKLRGVKLRRDPVPWKELLAEEREKTGRRSWRDFLFPWRQ